MAIKAHTPTKEQCILAKEILDAGGTKKAACEALGIKYNTKRMEKFLDDHDHREDVGKRIRAEKRKTAIDNAEAANIITDYINGTPYQDLSDQYYRSVGMIKYCVEKHGAALRTNKSIDPLNPPELPIECLQEEFEIDEYVWVAKYGCIGQVKGFLGEAIKVQTLGQGIQQKTYQPCYELGSLRHLVELGVDVRKFMSYTKGDEAKLMIYNAWKSAAKRDKEERKKK